MSEFLQLLNSIGLDLLIKKVLVKLPIFHRFALKVKESADESRLFEGCYLLREQALHLEVLFCLEIGARGSYLPQVKIFSFAQHFVD